MTIIPCCEISITLPQGALGSIQITFKHQIKILTLKKNIKEETRENHIRLLYSPKDGRKKEMGFSLVAVMPFLSKSQEAYGS